MTSSKPKLSSTELPRVSETATFAEPRANDFWRGVWRNHLANKYQDDQDFISSVTGLNGEFGLQDFNGDDQAVRDYFTVESMRDMGPDFGFIEWEDYKGFGRVQAEHRLTQSELTDMADTVISNGWHVTDECQESWAKGVSEKEAEELLWFESKLSELEELKSDWDVYHSGEYPDYAEKKADLEANIAALKSESNE